MITQKPFLNLFFTVDAIEAEFPASNAEMQISEIPLAKVALICFDFPDHCGFPPRHVVVEIRGFSPASSPATFS
jgi:hypothetical protein